ncbi:MAG: hypothetical protein PUI85_05305 [Eubacteriales bacterium]|nr:hypothetical protein [Eubacteriales bacterium]MDY3332517.1 hypothetical protein [Gallibacter sp.]
MEKDSKVVVFAEFVALKEEVERLRTELSMFLYDRDELTLVVCKNLEMEYMLVLGHIEHKAYNVQCKALRLKRKIELIQARKNRQESVVESELEDILDSEFEEYQRLLNEQIEKMNNALNRSRFESLSNADERELKKLYHKIVKALHPDINPDITDVQKDLFNKAVQAYEDGDLISLRIIEEMIGDDISRESKDSMVQLMEEKQRLIEMIEVIKGEIDSIKERFPYTMKEILEDSEKVEERKCELEDIYEQYQELIELYKAKIEEMLRV